MFRTRQPHNSTQESIVAKAICYFYPNYYNCNGLVNSMGLDLRLLTAAMELLKDKHPQEVGIKEIYDFIERKVEFTELQLKLHSQIAGQEELNWMHDIRNLLGTAKSKGNVINPLREHWALPRKLDSVKLDPELCFDAMVKRASLAVRTNESFSCKRTDSIFQVRRYSSENIEILKLQSGKIYNLNKEMVISKINHLLNCGGVLEIGMFHKWSIVESAIIYLCDQIHFSDSKVIRIDTF